MRKACLLCSRKMCRSIPYAFRLQHYCPDGLESRDKAVPEHWDVDSDVIEEVRETHVDLERPALCSPRTLNSGNSASILLFLERNQTHLMC